MRVIMVIMTSGDFRHIAYVQRLVWMVYLGHLSTVGIRFASSESWSTSQSLTSLKLILLEMQTVVVLEVPEQPKIYLGAPIR